MKRNEKDLKNEAKRPRETMFPSSAEILEQAFRISAKVSVSRKGIAPAKAVRTLNALKIHAFGKFLQEKLHGLSRQFPHLESLNPFYLDLLGVLANIPRLKQNLAKLSASSRIIKKLRYEHANNSYRSISIKEANRHLNSFQGRASSIMKRLNSPLKQLKEDSKKLIEIPSIDFEAPTAVLAGFPNVGKTTLLKRLTGSKARIAPYAFTTRQINSGFFEHKYIKVQVLDTPGLLDREKHNEIEKKAMIAVNHLASAIVFVLDPTLMSGYKLEEQLSLLGHIKTGFPEKNNCSHKQVRPGHGRRTAKGNSGDGRIYSGEGQGRERIRGAESGNREGCQGRLALCSATNFLLQVFSRIFWFLAKRVPEGCEIRKAPKFLFKYFARGVFFQAD